MGSGDRDEEDVVDDREVGAFVGRLCWERGVWSAFEEDATLSLS